MELLNEHFQVGFDHQPRCHRHNCYVGGDQSMMPRKFTDAQLDEAEAMHIKGEKWEVVDLLLGEGIKQACYYRKTRGYLGTYNDDLESLNAVMAWNGEGDRQSFIDGYKARAKRERIFK